MSGETARIAVVNAVIPLDCEPMQEIYSMASLADPYQQSGILEQLTQRECEVVTSLFLWMWLVVYKSHSPVAYLLTRTVEVATDHG
eukprot:CAMPEP_0172797934 /NCGR_PEP_ID=MMETSP1075-20121228/765_1 /TAXON_ID=2916 /ORGANISM="Ceratium fusus, Strain PA161109" /LENGTH=85 /DNA_ID=CAMNT_0013635271 /DNA_START=116 /DNA_END=373 /DNA_ORIENTATION=-